MGGKTVKEDQTREQKKRPGTAAAGGGLIDKYYRYGVAHEKPFLLEGREHVGGLVIPAHLLKYQEGSLPVFLREMNRPFYIDPMTYPLALFNYNLVNAKGDMKRSWTKLIKHLLQDAFGDFDFAKGQRLAPEDLMRNDEALLKTLCRSNIAMHEDVSGRDEDTERYLHLAAEIGEQLNIENDAPVPRFTTAPYFVTDLQDDWLRVNKRAVQITKELAGEEVYMVLALGQTALEGRFDERLNEAVAGADGVVLWLDGFNAVQADVRTLCQYLTLLEATPIKSVLAYGGAFEGLLSAYRVELCSSGITYGDWRESPRITGGGAVPPRYFNPETMSMMTRADLEVYLEYFPVPCACTVCAGHKGPDEFLQAVFPVDLAALNEQLRHHYIAAMAQHYGRFADLDRQGVVDAIDDRLNRFSDRAPQTFSQLFSRPMEKWREALAG